MFPLLTGDAFPFPAIYIQPLWWATMLPSLSPSPSSKEQIWRSGLSRSSNSEGAWGSLSMPKGAASLQGQNHLYSAFGVNLHPDLVSDSSLSGELSHFSKNRDHFEKNKFNFIAWISYPPFIFLSHYLDSPAFHASWWDRFKKNAKRTDFTPSRGNWGNRIGSIHPWSCDVRGWWRTRICQRAASEWPQVETGTDTCWTNPKATGKHC